MVSLGACCETTSKLVHSVWRRDGEGAWTSQYIRLNHFCFRELPDRNQTEKSSLPAQAKIWDCSLSKHPKLWVKARFRVLSLKIMLCFYLITVWSLFLADVIFHDTTSTLHESHELQCTQGFNLLGRFAWEICSLLSGRRQFSCGGNWWHHFNFPVYWYRKYFVLLDKGSELCGWGDLILLEIPVPQVIWSYSEAATPWWRLHCREVLLCPSAPSSSSCQPFTPSPADHIGTAALLWHSGGPCFLQ